MVIKDPVKKIFFLVLTVLVLSCAKQAPISGGPIDVEPPVMVESNPPMGATNFNQNIINIRFNEYIRLNNVNQKLVISPPITDKPVVTLSGKGFKISLKPELLLPNTTYSFNFNDAIADNNENNVLNSFVYAFSTGDYIDSLSVSGRVIDAFTKKAVEDVWVLLHKNISDTSVFDYQPAYVAKTDKDGKFIIPFIAENDYRIFALNDMNSNFLFDLPTESVAFLDSLIHPSTELLSARQLEYINDSLAMRDSLIINDSVINIQRGVLENMIDSLEIDEYFFNGDSILLSDTININNTDYPETINIVEPLTFTDSLKIDNLPFRNIPDNLELLLFVENKQPQFIKTSKRLTEDHLQIIFNATQYEEYEVKVSNDDNAVVYARNNPDTLNIWLANKELISRDSLRVFLKYTDPVYPDTVRYDTLRFRKPESTSKDTMVNLSLRAGKMPYENLIISSNLPIVSFDKSKIRLEMEEDSVYYNIDYNFNIRRDSLNPMILVADAEIAESTNYRIIVDSIFIINIKGMANSPDTLNIKTSSAADYGTLKVNVGDTTSNYIIYLLQSDKIVRESHSENGVVEFLYVRPGKYTMRKIKDINNNKRWDTGDLQRSRQPEPVFYYNTEYDIRSKWEHEIDWLP